ncbi:MAG TPA: STAS domain-containing protein [Solirubrobacteraceae bacterium]
MPQASILTSPTATSRYAAPKPFACKWQKGGSGAAWVYVAGELDLATASQLRQTLRDAQAYARLVVLDLRELAFIDSAGIHVILDASLDARQAERRLILVRGPAQVDRVVTLTGVPGQVLIVDLAPSEAPARALLHLAQRRAAA